MYHAEWRHVNIWKRTLSNDSKVRLHHLTFLALYMSVHLSRVISINDKVSGQARVIESHLYNGVCVLEESGFKDNAIGIMRFRLLTSLIKS